MTSIQLAPDRWQCSVCGRIMLAAAGVAIFHDCAAQQRANLLKRPPPTDNFACVHRGDRVAREKNHLCQCKHRYEAIHECAAVAGGRCVVEPYNSADVLAADNITCCQTCPLRQPEQPSAEQPSAISFPAGGTACFTFRHGLGDRVQFAGLLRHLADQRPGLLIDLVSPASTQPLFAGLVRRNLRRPDRAETYDLSRELDWPAASEIFGDRPSTKLQRSLAALGLDYQPELAAYQISTTAAHEQQAAAIAAALGQRFALVHNDGTTGRDEATGQCHKNMPREIAAALVRRLHARGLTPVVLNWRQRDPLARLPGVVQLGRGPHRATTRNPAVLCGLARRAAVNIGIDSGPGFVFAAAGRPTLIYWDRHHPLNYHEPADHVLHLLPDDHPARILPYAAGVDRRAEWDRGRDFFRARYRSRTYPATGCDEASAIAALDTLIDEPRYLAQPAADAQLRQWVEEWTVGQSSTGFGADVPADRNVSLPLLFAELRRRFPAPQIVETGCIRYDGGPHAGDFSGAGYFTLLAACYTSVAGGRLDSVDLSPANVAFARRRTRFFPSARIHQADSVAFLRQWPGPPIDLAYLDSLDTDRPGHAEHGLAEAQAVLPHLSPQALICFDDTAFVGGAWHPLGKGCLAIPWLLDRGWRVLFSGYQTILGRAEG